MKGNWDGLGVVGAIVSGVIVLACSDVKQPEAAPEPVTGQQRTQELRKLYYSKETVEQSSNVSAVERLTNSALIERSLNLSPDGKKLVFAAFDIDRSYGETGDTWVLNLDSGAQVRLTSMDTDERNPTWGGNGQYVYFETTSFGGRNIGRIHATETGGVMQITSGNGEVMPTYSDVHKKIVFALHTASVPNGLICTVNEDGRQYTQNKEGTQPRWSPDGNKIVYVRRNPNGKESQIWQMDASGANQTQLTGGNVDELPAYSPDGKHIVFVSIRGEKRDYNIWVMKADGSGQTQLTTNESADIYPIFGYDGRTVFFCSNRGGQWDVWKLVTTLQ